MGVGAYSIWQVEQGEALGIHPGHGVVVGARSRRRTGSELPFGRIPLAALWIDGRR